MKFKTLFLSLLMLAVVSCTTENKDVRMYGGTATLDLPEGEELVNITWKDTDLWYLTRQADSMHIPITYTFHEKSDYGIYNGTYIIKEH